MEALHRNISVVVGAVVAVIFQVAITPAISIAFIRPNALLAFCVVLAIVRPTNASMVVSFVLGLIYGVLSLYPLGLMAAVMAIVSFALTRVFSVLDGNSQIMVAICIAVSSLAAETLYGFLLIQFGMDVSFFGLFLYRIAPCALYDCVLAYLMYPIAHRFIGPKAVATHIPVARQFR